MPRHKIKTMRRKGERFERPKRPLTFRNPGGQITEVDLLRLSDRTGLTYGEIKRIYESMKNKG
ncbi:MAG: hypothetical protein C4291_11025 [Candidatus Dadabacteria bacterium]